MNNAGVHMKVHKLYGVWQVDKHSPYLWEEMGQY